MTDGVLFGSDERAVTLLQWVTTGIILDFAEEGYGHAEDIPDLEQQLREKVWHHCRVEPPILRCNLGHAMYLQDRGGRLVPSHWRREHDAINHGESDEHKACKERFARAMDERGLRVYAESSRTATGGVDRRRRNDLLIVGTTTVGYEAQYSYIHQQTVARRHNLAAADGVTVYFGVPGDSQAAANIVNHVPYGTYNNLPAEAIRAGRPMYITGGVRDLERWRCAEQPWRCPHADRRKRKNCTWHSAYTTLLRFGEHETSVGYDKSLGVTQENLLFGLATGLYVPIQLKRPGGRTWQIVPEPTINDFLSDGGQLWSRPQAQPAGAPRKQESVADLLTANPNCARPAELARAPDPNAWRQATVSAPAPCVLCRRPAILRHPVNGKPMHKACADEREAR